jgi:carboxymethylenebutenolidase
MMVEIHDRTVHYPGEGVTLMAYVTEPAKKEKWPAIIIVQEWWGLVEHIKDIARRFAREGYVAIAPDLYSRFGHVVTTDANEAGAFMNRLAQEDGLKDLQATVTYLQTVPAVDAARLGVTGFCMGGFYALMLPCLTSAIKATVPFYGQVPNPDTPLKKLGCPVLYFYGEDDGWITKADVQRLAAALKTYQKPGEIKTYPGATHAFFNDTRPEVYKAAEAQDAWARTIAFFKQQLV